MSDCANVEMRELLPELAAGALDASTRARVERHVASCADCASELETLRHVRSLFAVAQAIDTRRIVAALPKPVAPASSPAPVKRWVDWRIAAALTMITVGGLSVAVTQRMQSGQVQMPGDTSAVVRPIDSASQVAAISKIDSAPNRVDSGVRATQGATPRPSKAQLSFNGGVGDLDEASIHALLGALDEIDRAPVAPSAEPDRSSVLPVITEGDR
jgi:anti-sigma factor RsiW